MNHYKMTAWAMVPAAACMTGCSEKQLSDIPISENSSSITTENEISTTTVIIEETVTVVTAVQNSNTTELLKLSNSDEAEVVQTNSSDIFTERDLCLTPDLSDAVLINAADNSDYTISGKGVYYLTGKAENFTVNVDADKSDKVQIVLENAEISNENFPVI